MISLLYNYLILALRQHVTIFDTSTTDPGKQRQYLVGAWSILNSISSTGVRRELPGNYQRTTRKSQSCNSMTFFLFLNM